MVVGNPTPLSAAAGALSDLKHAEEEAEEVNKALDLEKRGGELLLREHATLPRVMAALQGASWVRSLSLPWFLQDAKSTHSARPDASTHVRCNEVLC